MTILSSQTRREYLNTIGGFLSNPKSLGYTATLGTMDMREELKAFGKRQKYELTPLDKKLLLALKQAAANIVLEAEEVEEDPDATEDELPKWTIKGVGEFSNRQVAAALTTGLVYPRMRGGQGRTITCPHCEKEGRFHGIINPGSEHFAASRWLEHVRTCTFDKGIFQEQSGRRMIPLRIREEIRAAYLAGEEFFQYNIYSKNSPRRKGEQVTMSLQVDPPEMRRLVRQRAEQQAGDAGTELNWVVLMANKSSRRRVMAYVDTRFRYSKQRGNKVD